MHHSTLISNTVKYSTVRAEGVDFDSVYSFNNRRSSQHIRNMGSVFLKKVKEQIQAQKLFLRTVPRRLAQQWQMHDLDRNN